MIDRVFPHDFSANLPYVFDWTPWLTEEGVTIASFVPTAQTGLTIGTTSNDDYTVTLWITVDSSVPLNKLLTLACKITTTGSPARVDERTITLKAVQL